MESTWIIYIFMINKVFQVYLFFFTVFLFMEAKQTEKKMISIETCNRRRTNRLVRCGGAPHSAQNQRPMGFAERRNHGMVDEARLCSRRRTKERYGSQPIRQTIQSSTTRSFAIACDKTG